MEYDEPYVELAPVYIGALSGPRLTGACGAGRDGVSEVAVTWLKDMAGQLQNDRQWMYFGAGCSL